MTTTIEIDRLVFHAYHGVLPQERQVGGTFTVDLRLQGNFSKACESDNLADSVDYGAVCLVVKEEMGTPSSLIEHVAARIAQRLLRTFAAIDSVDIRICKLTPPIPGIELKQACFRAVFDRTDIA